MQPPEFTRQPDSTHVVIYGNGCGELLVTYWPSESAAKSERLAIMKMARRERFDAHPRIQSLAEIDAIESGYDD